MKYGWLRWLSPPKSGSTGEAGISTAAAPPTLAELVALRERVAHTPWRRAVAFACAAGMHRSHQLGRGLEFAEVRAYQPGDDVRSIDWRHTARRGRPCTKVFHVERERPVLLLIDFGPSMQFGTRVAFKSVLAARAAAALAWAAVDTGDRVGAVICDAAGIRVVPPQGRQRGAFALIRAVAADRSELRTDKTRPSANGTVAATEPTPGFACALRALGRVAPSGSHIVLLSDFRGLDAEAHVELVRLAGRNHVALVHVFDAIEAEPPPPGLYRIADEHGEQVVDLRPQTARTAYGRPFRERRAMLAALARRLGAPLIPLATDDDPLRVLPALDGGTRFPHRSASSQRLESAAAAT